MRLKKTTLAWIFTAAAAAVPLPGIARQFNFYIDDSVRQQVLENAETSEMANLRLFNAKAISMDEFDLRQQRFRACIDENQHYKAVLEDWSADRVGLEKQVFLKVCREAARMP